MSVDPTPSQPTAEEFSAMVHDLTSMTDGAVPSSSQMRAARVLATTAASRLRHIFGTPTGWHWWDGMRWKPDGSNHARSELFTVVEKHLPSLVLLGVLPKSTVSELQRDNSQRGALAIASHLPEFATELDHVDAQPTLLNCTNGTLDLETFQLRPHDPGDLITQVTSTEYDPSATSPLWTAFLDVALPDVEVREYLQRLIGYSLLGVVTHHVFPILIGEGGNGKGTFYETIMHVLGDYAAPFDPSLLLMTRNDFKSANAPAPALLGLKGKRFVVTSETAENAKLATDKMKFYTGGDTMVARGMYAKADTTWQPSHTMFMITNHEPQLSADDAAAWQRITTIPFNIKIRGTKLEIPGFTIQLRQAAPAVLAWAVEGLKQFYEIGLAPPEQVVARTESYHARVDHIATYMKTRLVPAPPTERVPRTDIWNDWLVWARAEDVDPGRQSDFYAKITREFTPSKHSGVRVFTGVRLVLDSFEQSEEHEESIHNTEE